jgi:hypothetical protein
MHPYHRRSQQSGFAQLQQPNKLQHQRKQSHTTRNETIAATRLKAIQASNEVLHVHLGQALARIEQNIQKYKELAE